MPYADSGQYSYEFNGKKHGKTGLASRGSSKDIKSLRIADTAEDTELVFDFSKECALWRYPINTISQSERSYEENYQGSAVVPNWQFTLEPGKKVSFAISVRLA